MAGANLKGSTAGQPTIGHPPRIILARVDLNLSGPTAGSSRTHRSTQEVSCPADWEGRPDSAVELLSTTHFRFYSISSTDPTTKGHLTMNSPIASGMELRFPTPATISPSGSSSELRPFTCPEPGCFQRFKRKFTLKEHLKTHTGEKPFCCPVKSCGKTFTTSGNLARHKRLHPWLKPQVCLVDGCDKSFSNEVKLERHMKTHFKGPRILHPCRVLGCGKQFSTTGNLTRHMKQQHHDSVFCSDSDDASRSSVCSPCSVESVQSQAMTSATASYDRICFDASRAFNPLMDEISDVRDEELLETLQCLF